MYEVWFPSYKYQKAYHQIGNLQRYVGLFETYQQRFRSCPSFLYHLAYLCANRGLQCSAIHTTCFCEFVHRLITALAPVQRTVPTRKQYIPLLFPFMHLLIRIRSLLDTPKPTRSLQASVIKSPSADQLVQLRPSVRCYSYIYHLTEPAL